MAQVIGLLPLLSPSCSCSGSWERNLQMGMSSLSMSLLLNFFRKNTNFSGKILLRIKRFQLLSLLSLLIKKSGELLVNVESL